MYIRNNCELVLNKDIEGYYGYFRVVAFGFSFVFFDIMIFLKVFGIVKIVYGNFFGDVVR